MKKILSLFSLFSILFALVACGGSEVTVFKVSFDTQGGSAVSTQEFEEGEMINLNTFVSSKTDFDFLGWSLTADGIIINDLVVNEDIKLFAIFSELNREFSFKDLNVDFSGATALGIKVLDNDQEVGQSNAVLLSGRLNATYDIVTNTQLVKTDEDGNVSLVEFVNTNGDVVEVPYFVYYFEIIGDFTYIIYYQTQEDLMWLNGQFASYHNSSVRDVSILSYILMTAEDNDYFNGFEDDIREIAIHNESGKVFDYTDIFQTIMEEDEIFIKDFFISNEGQFFSSFNAETWETTCTHEVKFDQETLSLEVNKSCFDVGFRSIIGFDSNHFIYEYEDYQTNQYFMKDGNTINIVGKQVVQFFLSGNQTITTFWSDGSLVKYDYQLNILEETQVIDEEIRFERYSFYGNTVYTVKNNQIMLRANGQFIVYDIDTNEIVFQYDLTQFGNEGQNFHYYLYLEKDLLLISSDTILRYDTESMEIHTLYSGSNIESFHELYATYRATGYFKITYIDGLTKVTKVIDPVTGEEVSSSQSDIAKDVWFVKPLN